MRLPASGDRRDTGRPVIAVVAAPASTEPLRALVRQLARVADIRSLDRIDGRPDGVLAASVDSLDRVPPRAPVALWVADARAVASFARGTQRSRADVRVLLSADPAAVDTGAIAVAPEALDVGALPVLAPLVRARWRKRYGLPSLLVVAIEPVADPDGDALSALALAASAVVTGPLIASALALGTPTVTTPDEAARLGLRPGREVEVADHDSSMRRKALARAIAADDGWAASRSLAARRFAEARLDLGRTAKLVLHGLGLAANDTAGWDPLVRLDRRMSELATAPNAFVRGRAAVATACFTPARS